MRLGHGFVFAGVFCTLSHQLIGSLRPIRQLFNESCKGEECVEKLGDEPSTQPPFATIATNESQGLVVIPGAGGATPSVASLASLAAVASFGNLEPCRVLIMNSAPWHSEILESIAKQLPLSALGLTTQKVCNPYHLVFDYKLRERFNSTTHAPRNQIWVEEYFDKFLKNTTTIETTDNTGSSGGLAVIREIRSASLIQLGTHERRWRKKRASYTTNDEQGQPYHSVVEATCYCSLDGKGATRDTKDKAWLADWMLNAPLAKEGSGQARTCIFHEQCPDKYHTPQGIWVSPHFDNYFIPWSLPFAYTDADADADSKNVPSTSTTTKSRSPPVICSIGNTKRRNFKYVQRYLDHYTSSTSKHYQSSFQHQDTIGAAPKGIFETIKNYIFNTVKEDEDNNNTASNYPTTSRPPKVIFRILGRGKFPLADKYRDLISHYTTLEDDLDFANKIKDECDALVVLVDPKTHPDYFLMEDSQYKLSGSIPPILAYRKPYILHKDLMDLYSQDLLPLNLPHSTFDNSQWSFVQAIVKFAQELHHDGAADQNNPPNM